MKERDRDRIVKESVAFKPIMGVDWLILKLRRQHHHQHQHHNIQISIIRCWWASWKLLTNQAAIIISPCTLNHFGLLAPTVRSFVLFAFLKDSIDLVDLWLYLGEDGFGWRLLVGHVAIAACHYKALPVVRPSASSANNLLPLLRRPIFSPFSQKQPRRNELTALDLS